MASRQFNAARGLLGGLAMLLVAGCSTMPAPGPTTRDVTGDAGPESGYAVVDVTPAVLPQLDAVKRPSLAETFGAETPLPTPAISPGDQLSVVIWDAGGGLFSPEGASATGTQTTVLPTQTVDIKGNISVPFAGQIHVAGKSTLQAQSAITAGLGNQAIRPQALVTVVNAMGNQVTVIGDVKTPGRVTLNVGGTRALDAIAQAGGNTAPAFDSVLQLTRKGKTTRVRVSWIISHPNEDIYLQPNDVLYILKDPRMVTILGALKTNSRLQFDTEHLTLAEALGQGGGLLDDQSEPAGVFVFRVEPASLITALTSGPAPAAGAEMMPVVFRVDMRQPQNFFMAQSFQLQDKDIVYVANAESVQLDKVLKIMAHAAVTAGVIANKNGIAAVQ
jgi:polysaccharide export outer membrane protein